MTLPASGAISLSQVNTELGNSSTAVISLNDSAVRTLFGKASGAISMSDGYGKSNSYTIEFRVYGAQGGLAQGGGGLGGYTNWQGKVNPGTVVTWYVGNGAGYSTNSGGGGGSAILIGGTLIAVAGGGGGGSTSMGAGGAGGGTTGGSGGMVYPWLGATAGSGGSQSGVGSGGHYAYEGNSVASGLAGNSTDGGNGGRSEGFARYGGYGSGGAGYFGGGGGYRGGGGGAWWNDWVGEDYFTGGGGGSGYTRTTGLPSGVTYTTSSMASGQRSGAGLIQIYKNGSLLTTLSNAGYSGTYTIA